MHVGTVGRWDRDGDGLAEPRIDLDEQTEARRLRRRLQRDDFGQSRVVLPGVREERGRDSARFKMRGARRCYGRAGARPYRIGCRRWMGGAARTHTVAMSDLPSPNIERPSSILVRIQIGVGPEQPLNDGTACRGVARRAKTGETVRPWDGGTMGRSACGRLWCQFFDSDDSARSETGDGRRETGDRRLETEDGGRRTEDGRERIPDSVRDR